MLTVRSKMEGQEWLGRVGRAQNSHIHPSLLFFFFFFYLNHSSEVTYRKGYVK